MTRKQTILNATRETTPRKEWNRPGLVVLLAVPLMSMGILVASLYPGFAQGGVPDVVGSPTPSPTPTPPQNNVIYTFNTNSNPEGIVISPDSKTLYVACPGGNTVDVINATISNYPVVANLNAPNPPGGNLVYMSLGRSLSIRLGPRCTSLEQRRICTGINCCLRHDPAYVSSHGDNDSRKPE